MYPGYSVRRVASSRTARRSRSGEGSGLFDQICQQLFPDAPTEASTVRRAGSGVRGSRMVRYILDSVAGGLMGAAGKVIVVTDGASGLRPASGTGETL